MENLLEPLSESAPCGVDLSYDPVYNDLAVLIQGTPENQFEPGSAKEPNWPAIRKLSEESLRRSLDLQIAVYYTVAMAQTAGMDGAARGIELLAAMVRKYWDGLFPALDPEDKDPTQRVNILSQLTVEPGAYGDPVKFIERIGTAPIFRVAGLAVTVALLTQDSKSGQGTGAARLPEMMATGNAEEIAAGVGALRRVVDAVHALDDFLVQTLGRSAAPSFDPLIKVVDKALRLFDGVLPPAAGAPLAGAVAVGAGGGAAAVAQGISGEILSDDDVRKAIDKIRAYYAANEPSSPVPYLLERAKRLVGRDFLDLLTNLTPAARPVFDVLMGPTAEQEEAAKKAAAAKK
jgi:type VI secretion system protein ImpA